MKTSRIAALGAATVMLAGGLVLAGCGDSGSSSSVPADVPADAAYAEINNQSGDAAIGAMVGKPLIIKLVCNGGTGYQWQMKKSGDSVVSLKKSTGCEPDDKSTTLAGAGGHETWTFDVTTAGTETLTFLAIPPGQTKAETTQNLKVVAS